MIKPFSEGLNAHITSMCLLLGMRIQEKLRDIPVGGGGYTAGRWLEQP